jgi:DNA-binding NarL/FixJ family response regulator
MRRSRVLLAEDYLPVAEQLRLLLAAEFDVIATVADGFALIGAAQTLLPDAIVADIEMPGLDGITAAEQLLDGSAAAVAQRGGRAAPRIVLVTVHNEPMLVKRAFDAGVSGYVMKLRAGEELVTAVHAALRGEHFASPMVFSGQP